MICTLLSKDMNPASSMTHGCRRDLQVWNICTNFWWQIIKICYEHDQVDLSKTFHQSWDKGDIQIHLHAPISWSCNFKHCTFHVIYNEIQISPFSAWSLSIFKSCLPNNKFFPVCNNSLVHFLRRMPSFHHLHSCLVELPFTVLLYVHIEMTFRNAVWIP